MNPRKKQITDAAHRLFSENGFAQTSIQDILDEAQIAKGTFYNYFASKNECLIAILETVNEKAERRRIELAQGENKADENVLVSQIAVRLDMNRYHNLLAIFGSVACSDDNDLKAFFKKNQTKELNWIAKRLVDVFGEEEARHAVDHAVMLTGCIHQIIRVWNLGANTEMATETVVQFALDQLKPVIREGNKKAFFPKNWLDLTIDSLSTDYMEMKQQLIIRLSNLTKKLEKEEKAKNNEYVQFLLKEFQSENPRLFLLESVLLSLKHVFEGSSYELEISQIVKMAWHVLDSL